MEPDCFVSCHGSARCSKSDEVCWNMSRDFAGVRLVPLPQTVGIVLSLALMFAVRAKLPRECLVIRIKPETKEQSSSSSPETLLQSPVTPCQDIGKQSRVTGPMLMSDCIRV